MSTLKKDHVLGAGTSAIAGGAVGAAIGGVVAGPPGIALGAAAGTAVGAILGHKTSEAIDPRGNLGHFQQIHHTMPYFKAGMTWDDYAPAYQYGLDTYTTQGAQAFELAEAKLSEGWPRARDISRLDWQSAAPAVAHAWRELDQALQGTGRSEA